MSRSRKTRRRPGGRALWRRWRGKIALLIVAAAVAATVFFAVTGPKEQFELRAAIVDQLSLTAPNPTFVETATETLEEAGYTVDYYPGEEITVEFYRRLPSLPHDLLILRIHSGATIGRDYLGLFTSEPYEEERYSPEESEEDVSLYIGRGRYYEDSDPLFVVGPDFIRSKAKGTFNDATVIMMGCDGMRFEGTAEAFIHKGAKAFVGWTGLVSAEHTDAATEALLRYLVIDKLDPEEAVAKTMDEVGPDPAYESTLRLALRVDDS